MPPRISVVIPVHNSSNVIRHSVDSVLAQTLPVSEVILIDDGSTEDVETEVRRNIAEKPAWRERVHYFYQENQGQSVAINNGIARAKEEWIAINAHDDIWLPFKLEWQFNALEQFRERCGACFTDAWFMNTSAIKTSVFQHMGKNYGGTVGLETNPFADLGTSRPIWWVQSLVVRADLVRKVGGFDSNLRFGEDDEFLFRLACETDFCFVNMPMMLIDRRPGEVRHVGAAKEWHKVEFRLRMDQYRFEKRVAMSHALTPEVQRAALHALAGVHSGWATWYLANKEYAEARVSISKAAKYHLSRSIAIKWALTHLAPGLARALSIRKHEREARTSMGMARLSAEK